MRYNVFGGTFSGPFRKNKAFYFLSYEAARRRDGTTVTMTVPSALERAGDFSQTFNANGRLAIVYDPNSGPPASRTAFPGNRIPTDRLDPVALNVIQAYPLPNRAPDNVAGSNNFSASTVNVLDRDNVTAKAGYNVTGAHKLSGRFLWNRQDQAPRSVYADPAAEPSSTRNGGGWNLLGSWTAILSPTMISEFRAARVMRTALVFSPSIGQHYPTKLGLRGIPDDAFPRFNLTGYTALGSNQQTRHQPGLRHARCG